MTQALRSYLLGVTAAGMRTPELRRLLEVWPTPQGHHPLVGSERRTDPDTAASLSPTSSRPSRHVASSPVITATGTP